MPLLEVVFNGHPISEFLLTQDLTATSPYDGVTRPDQSFCYDKVYARSIEDDDGNCTFYHVSSDVTGPIIAPLATVPYHQATTRNMPGFDTPGNISTNPLGAFAVALDMKRINDEGWLLGVSGNGLPIPVFYQPSPQPLTDSQKLDKLVADVEAIKAKLGA